MQNNVTKLRYDSRNGQCAVMLLAAIRDLAGAVTKREATDYIRKKHWFAFEPDDNLPYLSQHEPRWQNIVAWGRKECVMRNLISYDSRDNWGMTRDGRDTIDRLHRGCINGDLPVYPCYIWSAEFKQFMNPNYNASSSDAKRPPNFYRDLSERPTVEDYLLKHFGISI